MIRLIGAVLITAGTAAWGLLGVFRLRGRVRSLQAVASALGVMKSEICDRLTPMPELMRSMADEATYPASQLFKNASEKMASIGAKPFSALWSQAVRNTPEMLLKPRRNWCHGTRARLAGTNVAEQAHALQYAQRRMEEHIRRAETERDSNSKVHAFLGVAAGLFAIIILL
jgi:stage III sporulation protein AB